MILFNFLKRFGKRDKTPKSPRLSLPTVTPEASLFECYEEVFSQEMVNVSGISSEEVTEIYELVARSEGGFLNMAAYFNPVHEKYFKDREWAWIEYEDWNNRFKEIGRFPVSFQKKIDYTSLQITLGLLTIADLKKLLAEKNITTNPKARKRELVALAQKHVDICNSASISQVVAEKKAKERHFIYTELMRTIAARAKTLHDHRRASNLGIVEFRLNQVHASDEEFSNMALQMTSRFLPPLYPYDHSYLTSVINLDH